MKRRKERKFEGSTFAKETLGISTDCGDKTTVLGVVWNTRKDTLEIELSK